MLILISRLEFSIVLLSCYLSAPVFCSESSTNLLSYCMPTLISCSRSPAVLLSGYVLVFCCGILALLLLLPLLSLTLLFESLSLRTFK